MHDHGMSEDSQNNSGMSEEVVLAMSQERENSLRRETASFKLFSGRPPAMEATEIMRGIVKA